MNDPLISAMGNALAMIGALLQRQGVIKAQEIANMLAILGSVDAGERPEESAILCAWAAMIEDAARGIDGEGTVQ